MKFGYLLIAAALPLFAGCSGSSNSSRTHEGTPQTVAQASSQAKQTVSSARPDKNASPAGAASVEQAIKTDLGDVADYRQVFERLQQGVKAGDKQAVAALVAYPLEVRINGKTRTIADAQAFVENWDKIITPDIAKVIKNQKFADLFVNQKGVMFGDGQVWLSGICRDEACTSSYVRVITIQR